jgi:flap endonuclease-1
MGIKNLHKLLKKWDDIIVPTKIDHYAKKKIAIDISILVYQIVIAIRNTGADLTNSKGEITSHLIGIFNKTISMLEMGIYPVYVFDGKPPKMKSNILKSRRDQRNKAKIKMSQASSDQEKIKYFKRSVVVTKKQLNQCKELIRLMGIPVIEAPEEADSQCAQLAKDNLVYGVSTEDMDILTFGSTRIIRNLSSRKKEIIQIELDKILEKLNINYDQFIDLCILLGCDYCNTIPGIGMKKAYQIIKKYGSIEKFLLQVNENEIITLGTESSITIKPKIPNMFPYNETKEYFKKPNVLSKEKIQLKWSEPNYDSIINYMVNIFGFNKSKIIRGINRLKRAYNNQKKKESSSVVPHYMC